MQKDKQEYFGPPLIVGVEVDNLFGHYTYRLGNEIDEATKPSQLLLLYGDNGTGKTTIAQLLFHMLSSGDGRGPSNIFGTDQIHAICSNFQQRNCFSRPPKR